MNPEMMTPEELDRELARVDRHFPAHKLRAHLDAMAAREAGAVRALRRVREAHYPAEEDHDVPECQCTQCLVRDASGPSPAAPPVFTLEEVRAQFDTIGLSKTDKRVTDIILGRLAALRK